MNKTQSRLTALANELQDIAAKYEELSAPPIEPMDKTRAIVDDFLKWLHKEGYVYTRGEKFHIIFDVCKNILLSQTSLIKQLQTDNQFLMAGINPHSPPEAFTLAGLVSTNVILDDLSDLDINTNQEDDEDPDEFN